MSISSALPVGQPLSGVSFAQAIKRFFRGYVVFSGRASRGEFWWAMLFTFLVSLAIQVPFWLVWGIVIARTAAISGEIGSVSGGQDIIALSGVLIVLMIVVLLLSLALVLPTYAVMWRRLQDANFHGAFSLLSLVGLGVVPLVMCALPSHPAGAQYDPAHRAQMAAYGYDGSYAQPHGYASSTAYGASTPYGQSTPYNPSTPYGQPEQVGQQQIPPSGPYEHAGPYGHASSFEQAAPYEQASPYSQPYSGGYPQDVDPGGPSPEQQPRP